MKLVLVALFGLLGLKEADGVALPLPRDNLFQVVWQMPTGLCQKFEEKDSSGRVTRSMNFHLDDFGIINNPRNRFDGEYTAIFYHFGRFPMYAFGNEHAIDNGGVPARGNLTLHMVDAAEDIKKEIPNPDFAGIAVINQEEWRPNWDKNFGWKSIYQKKSIEYYAELHPEITDKQVLEEKAAEEFEKWTRIYSTASLELGKESRIHGKWGYYAYPYCYNFKPPVQDRCKDAAISGNNKMKWLWEASTVILPSGYYFLEYEPLDRARFLYSQIEEGVRVSQMSTNYTPVYVYTKMKYNMSLPVFLFRKQDMYASVRMPADFGVEGLIMWGSDPEFNEVNSCTRMRSYVLNTLGPYVQRVNRWASLCGRRRCNGNGRCVHRGALDRRYMEEVYRLQMSDLEDFSINYKYKCRCLEGYQGNDCSQRIT